MTVMLTLDKKAFCSKIDGQKQALLDWCATTKNGYCQKSDISASTDFSGRANNCFTQFYTYNNACNSFDGNHHC